ncbi:unnamed protein product [Meloidogyne enterolobii]|uniref:Uncharacterized protein n=1 Tax=Meloidogyne enterolobii TaxID=390850 RepID=A0ACB0ZCR7_MELEN
MFGRDPIFCVDQILDPRVRDPIAFNDTAEFKQLLVTSLRVAWESAAEAHKEAQIKMKEQYDKHTRVSTIEIGDRVLIRNYAGKPGTSKKFHLPWKGIYRVINIEGIYVTITSCNSPQANPRKVHINQIKKCFEYLGPVCTIPGLSQEEKSSLKSAEAIESEHTPGFDHNINTDSIQNTNHADNKSRNNTECQENPNTHRYNLRPRNP